MNALLLILLLLNCHNSDIEVLALNDMYAFKNDTLSLVLKNNIDTEIWYTCSLSIVNSSYPNGSTVIENIRDPYYVSKAVACEKLKSGKKITIRIPAENIRKALEKYFHELKTINYICEQQYKIRINYSIGNSFKEEKHVDSNIFKFSLK